MNIHKDLLENILLNLNYQEIINLCENIKYINDYCKEHNILNKRRTWGFPRKSKRCEVHDVSYLVEKIPDVKLPKKFYEDHDEYIIKKSLNLLLNLIYKNNLNLIFGDVIYAPGIEHYNCLYIFNGREIIQLDYEFHDYGHLPVEFTIIHNDVPIKYWCIDELENSIIWLDIRNLKDHCINNIKEQNQMISTTFIYNNIIYTIIFSSLDGYEHEHLERFSKILHDENFLLLEYDDTYNILNGVESKNTLFFNYDMYEFRK